jgi:hypothetical protein
MSIVYDAIVKTGTYQKDGVEKNKWTKVGVVMKTKQGGLALKLDTIPTNGDWNGWISLSEPRAKDGAPTQAVSQPVAELSDDVPF